MPYATGQYHEDFGGETGTAGNDCGKDGSTTTWWISWKVSMYNLNFSSAVPCHDPLHLLVDNCIPYATGQYRMDFGAETGTAGNYCGKRWMHHCLVDKQDGIDVLSELLESGAT